jgi:diguanylate cyclase (GGDEF)-like protein
MILTFAVRSAAALLHLGGDITMLYFNPLQERLLVLLVFLSMVWNFGFVLMAIERLRAEVANLALVDDLTGVANRRHLLARLSRQCALSQRSFEPFALLAIDLDGFKEINDGFGHAAGDDCLRHFTLMAQTRLRPGDLLARTGGDEFCIVLPATTQREAAAIARGILEACRTDADGCTGAEISIAASIGVAQWSPAVGTSPERLIVAADRALYAAKKQGKNRCAVHEPAPELAPEMAPLRESA